MVVIFHHSIDKSLGWDGLTSKFFQIYGVQLTTSLEFQHKLKSWKFGLLNF